MMWVVIMLLPSLAFTTVDEVVDYIKTHDNAGPTDHEVGIR